MLHWTLSIKKARLRHVAEDNCDRFGSMEGMANILLSVSSLRKSLHLELDDGSDTVTGRVASRVDRRSIEEEAHLIWVSSTQK